MRFHSQPAIVALIACGLGVHSSSAQTETQKLGGSDTIAERNPSRNKLPASRTLSADDGLSVIASALDSRVRLRSESDCSHLVHAIYDRAGFPYPYMSSSSLYAGTSEFQRVTHAQPGDLVVWPGHVGIVVNPAQNAFFSTLGSGPAIDSYEAPYWRQRGRLRFYRYIKTGPVRGAPNRLLRTHQNK